jgi:small multidrug resistance pump
MQICCFFAILKNEPMKYLFLSLAIIFEIIGTSFMQASNGFSKTIPTILTIVAYIVCFYFFSQALKTIPLGIAYAIWGGLGIVLSAIISVVVFKQSLDIPALIGIALIVSGVFVMNFFSKSAVH